MLSRMHFANSPTFFPKPDFPAAVKGSAAAAVRGSASAAVKGSAAAAASAAAAGSAAAVKGSAAAAASGGVKVAAGGPFFLAARSFAPRLLLAAGLFLVACGPGPVPNEPVGEISAPPTRPSDGLLTSPVLQEVVDLQVARDGAGLTAFLRSEDPVVRARAAYALASVQDPGAGSTLAALLADPDADVRQDAAFALGQLNDPIYGAGLLGALRDETDSEVRGALLEALGKAGDARVLENLMGLDILAEEEPARNLAIARMGLNGITLPTSISFLISALENETGEARVNAAYYFGRNPDASSWVGFSNSVRAVLDSLPASHPTAMQLLLGLSVLGDQGTTPVSSTGSKGLLIGGFGPTPPGA